MSRAVRRSASHEPHPPTLTQAHRPLVPLLGVAAFVAALLVVGVPVAAASTTYFASPSGSDAITCAANSQANPFATVQAALGCTVNGDAVSLAPSGATPYPGVGAVAHNVTIKAEPGANARSVEVDVSPTPGPMSVASGTSVTVAGVALLCEAGLPPDFAPCGPDVTNNGTLTLRSDFVTGSTENSAIRN